jgi:outer membrane protein W
MKRLALLATTVLFAGASNAAEIRNSITHSIQLKVAPQVVVSTPTADSYSVSGSNVDVTTLGKIGTAGSYAIDTNGAAFSFTETELTAGTTTTTQSGGTAGNLAGTINTTAGGSLTVTAGGSGSEAIGQTAIELSVFQ